MNVNLARLWDRVAETVPERPALIAPSGTLTWKQFEGTAARLAAAWRDWGVGSGERIGLYLYNSPEYLIATYAAYKLGAVAANMNYRYHGAELTHLLNDSGAAVLVYDVVLADRVAEIVDAAPALRVLMETRGSGPSRVPGASTYADMIAAGAEYRDPGRQGSDTLIIYTGGTTGMPKGVVWSHRSMFDGVGFLAYGSAGEAVPSDLDGVAEVARKFTRAGREPRLLPVAPLMHGTALTAATAALLTGGCIVLTEDRSLDASSVWRHVQDHEVSRMVIAGNAIGRPLGDELEAAVARDERYDISTLDVVVSSGVPWSDDVKRAFLRRGRMTLIETFAASEGGPFAYAVSRSLDEVPGRLVPADGVRVIDERDRDVSPGSGQIGVLAFSGPMSDGYFGDPEKTASVYRDIGGVRHVIPGDFVRVRDDGSLELLGRGATVINSGGEKVFAGEVEAVLLAHEHVLDCAVVGVPDERWNEIVSAVVVTDGSSVSAQELKEAVVERLADHKKPRHVLFVPELPRAQNGKLNITSVRELAAAQFSTSPEDPG